MSKHEPIADAGVSTPTIAGPPRLPMVLRVGVTGHRVDTLSAESIASLPARIGSALRMITDGAVALHARDPSQFSSDPPRFEFVSPLADGADQVAAEAALALGYGLHAVLPFQASDYRGDLLGEEAQARFDTLLDRAESCLELPGDRSNIFDAYVMAGRATVAHSDLLIAVWDGLKARGRGGTGEVVELAIARGRPVIHLSTDSGAPERLLWAGFDPVVDTSGVDPMAERPLDADHVEQMLKALLLPPPDEQEKQFLARFFTEKIHHFRLRIEYLLLLALAGIRRLRARDFTQTHGEKMIREEWESYRKGCAIAHDFDARIDLLEHSYSWCDRLATHLAQTYRSGHVFNFVLGGLAVCIGLSGFMAPDHVFALSAVEFVITLAIICNTIFGTRGEWHRRWLDYRQLAERLRPMRSFKLLGISAPDPPGTATNPVPQRWIEWYAMVAWRALGPPSARITAERVRLLAVAVAEHEILPQVDYNNHSAQRMHLLDHRLDYVGNGLFFATLVVSVAQIIGYATSEDYVNTLGNWFQLISAGFPALGTAIFGIRYQGDFGGTANRSQSTSQQLKAIEDELRKDPTLLRAADLTEQAARVMLGDLDEWCLVHQRHELSI